ncbi:MAG: hypothetical protein QME51_02620 [Planctomycetota bacterium]|nr:hypothetical protein [Planctomycetota bacterium]MDI6787248.1 hypothetical protein [Planctomycetota bacterium]
MMEEKRFPPAPSWGGEARPFGRRWPLYVTIIIALIIGWLYSFGMLQSVSSRHKTITVGLYEIEISTRSELDEGKPARINLIVTSLNKPTEVKLSFYSLDRKEARPVLVHKIPPPKKDFATISMLPAGETGFYTVQLPPLKMAERYYYYINLVDEKTDTFSYPEGAPDKKLLNITYRREGIRWVTVLHIIMMYMVVFFLLHTIYYALTHIAFPSFPITKTIASVIWANIFFFITSFPIGCYVAYRAYGEPWTGIPEVLDPNDVDNKSLFIFIYWVIILLLIKGVSQGKNKITTKVFTLLSVIGALATIYLFISGGHN